MTNFDDQLGGERTLKSWKEIAIFFGKDERTVKRWETRRGLPIHRLPGQTAASVYAYRSELEHWLNGNGGKAIASPEAVAPADTPSPGPEAHPSRHRSRLLPVLAAMALAVLTGAAYLSFAGLPSFLSAPAVRVGGDRLSENEQAREQYLFGVYQLNLRTEAGLNRAVQHFTGAISYDPQFAAAFSGLSKAYNLLSQYTLMPADQAYPLAKAAAEQALKLDPELASAHASLALTEFYWLRDFQHSRQRFERALSLDPDSAEINHWYALAMMQMGEMDKAIAAISRAHEINPDGRSILANKALVLYHAGQMDAAEHILLQFVESAPDYVAPHFYLADLYFDAKRYRESLHHSLEAARLQKNKPMEAIYTAALQGYNQRGVTGLLEAMLAEQIAQNAKDAEKAYKIARTEAFLGRTDAALGYLQTAIDSREQDVLGIQIDSAFDGLRGDARFQRLVAEIGYVKPSSGVPVAAADDEARIIQTEAR